MTPIILLAVILLLAIGFVVGTAAALWRWRGGWRVIAGLPLLGVVAVIATIIVDIGADPTAHNLWPFEVLGAVVIAGVALGGIQLLRLMAQSWLGRAERS